MHGYVTRSDVLKHCETINNDDLRLKEDKNIPIKLINSIYMTIQDMRKSPSNYDTLRPTIIASPQTVMTVSESQILLTLSGKGVITSSGMSFLVNGTYKAKVLSVFALLEWTYA